MDPVHLASGIPLASADDNGDATDAIRASLGRRRANLETMPRERAMAMVGYAADASGGGDGFDPSQYSTHDYVGPMPAGWARIRFQITPIAGGGTYMAAVPLMRKVPA